MLNIGCHLSASKGFKNMGEEALKINANTFQFFTRNPRGGQAKKIDESDVQGLLKIMQENNFAKILAHAWAGTGCCPCPPVCRPAPERPHRPARAVPAASGCCGSSCSGWPGCAPRDSVSTPSSLWGHSWPALRAI